MDNRDRFRFAHGLLLFNTTSPANNTTFLLENNDFVNRYDKTSRIVDIHAWCLMPNHYHLLISEREENGLQKFMRKLNVGYANYFNKRYKRDGSLFQGRTKKIMVDSDAHFLHILHYIHLNPLDLTADTKQWRERSVANARKAKQQLDQYRWSSFHDYCGKKNFPTLLTTGLFRDSIGDIKKETVAYLDEIVTKPIAPLMLE